MTTRKSYSDTSVHWSRSQTEIVRMLNARGIYQTRFTNMHDKFAMEFVAEVDGQKKPVAVRIVVPFGADFSATNEDKRQKELSRLHRVLFHHLKAKFVAVDSGLTEFMEEFMSHLIIMDKQGNSTTMGQRLLPQYRETLDSGEQKDFNLLGDGK